MYRKFIAVALLLAGFWCLGQQEGRSQLIGEGVWKAVTSATYIGPGDIVSGAANWWSPSRCYSAAYSGNVVDIVDTATGNTTGSRLQCASGVVSTLVSGSACTFVTGNSCSTIATTCAVSCAIKTLYDQSGHSQNITQGVSAQPLYVVNSIGSHAALRATVGLTLAGTITSINQPLTVSSVAKRVAAFTTEQDLITDGATLALGFSNVANSVAVFAGSFRSVTGYTDGNYSSLQFIVNAGSSSVYIDGSSVVFGASVGTNSLATGINVPGVGGGGDASLLELGLWGSAFNGTQQSNMCHNQFAFYGTPTSC